MVQKRINAGVGSVTPNWGKSRSATARVKFSRQIRLSLKSLGGWAEEAFRTDAMNGKEDESHKQCCSQCKGGKKFRLADDPGKRLSGPQRQANHAANHLIESSSLPVFGYLCISATAHRL